MLITATFTGPNGSMGFRTGQLYQLHVEMPSKGLVLIRSKEHGACPYKSLQAFLLNWRNISLVIS